MLRDVRTVIVDEIHALADNKRGAHLSLSLERLAALVDDVAPVPIGLSATRTLATLLQRCGRSGHAVGAVPKGRLFPQTRDELVECVALLDMLRRQELDEVMIPICPLDVLAQQIVAEVAAREWTVDELYRLCRRAYAYHDLGRGTFDQVIRMLADGFSLASGRRGAHLHLDAINGRVHARRGARLTALTRSGAIPDNADYDVVLEPGGQIVGTVSVAICG